jgi:hypothetical protein
MPKETSPKTTIWKNAAGSLRLVRTLPGLPYGALRGGQMVDVQGLGKAQCTAVIKAGPFPGDPFVELMLTLE